MRSILFFGTFSFAAALSVSAASCVGDVPATADGGDGGGSEGGPGDDGSTEGGGKRTYACTIANGTGIVPIKTFNQPAAQTDRERSGIYPLDATHAVVVLPQFGNGSQLINAFIVSLDGSDPKPTPLKAVPVPSDRLVWLGRVADGVGLLTFTKNAGGGIYNYWKMTDAEILGDAIQFAQPTASFPVADMNTVFDVPNGANLYSIDATHMFFVADVSSKQQEHRLVSGSLSGGSVTTKLWMLPDVPFGGNAVVNNSYHAFTVTFSGNAISPRHIIFPLDNSAPSPPQPLPNDYCFGAVPVPQTTSLAFAFAEGDLTNGLDFNALRVGTIPNNALDPVKPNVLPSTPLGPTDFPIGPQVPSHVGWATFPSAPPILLMLNQADPMGGLHFFWFDADGALRARVTDKSTLLAGMAPNMIKLGAVPDTAPAANGLYVSVMYVSRDPNPDGGTVDSAFITKIRCQ